jgi:hypothetical protein
MVLSLWRSREWRRNFFSQQKNLLGTKKSCRGQPPLSLSHTHTHTRIHSLICFLALSSSVSVCNTLFLHLSLSVTLCWFHSLFLHLSLTLLLFLNLSFIFSLFLHLSLSHSSFISLSHSLIYFLTLRSSVSLISFPVLTSSLCLNSHFLSLPFLSLYLSSSVSVSLTLSFSFCHFLPLAAFSFCNIKPPTKSRTLIKNVLDLFMSLYLLPWKKVETSSKWNFWFKWNSTFFCIFIDYRGRHRKGAAIYDAA